MKVDWDRVRSLLQEGRSHSSIATELGCARTTISAYVRRARQKAEITRLANTIVTATTSDRAAWFLAAMGADCEATFRRITSAPTIAGDLDFELKRERVLELLNKRARTTYGLDSTSGGMTVGISLSFRGTRIAGQETVQVESQPVQETVQEHVQEPVQVDG